MIHNLQSSRWELHVLLFYECLITWLLFLSFRTRNTRHRLVGEGKRLEITNAQLSNSGYYCCMATNGKLTVTSRKARVDVFRPRKFHCLLSSLIFHHEIKRKEVKHKKKPFREKKNSMLIIGLQDRICIVIMAKFF